MAWFFFIKTQDQRAVATIGPRSRLSGSGGDYRLGGRDYRLGAVAIIGGYFALEHKASGRSRLSVSGGDSCGVTIDASMIVTPHFFQSKIGQIFPFL